MDICIQRSVPIAVLSTAVPLTPALPAPLPKFARVLIKGVPFVTAGLEAFYDYITEATAVQDVQWRYVVLRWSRSTPVGTVEDHAQIGINIVNITGGNIDTTWTTGDYTTCEGFLDEWVNVLAPYIHQSHTLVDYRWYVRQFAVPMTAVKRFADTGPPARITPKSTAMLGIGTCLPYQSAMSVTLRTPTPRHWGRFYLPGIPPANMAASSRLLSSVTVSLANNVAELADDLAGQDFQMVVPTTQVNRVLVPALQTVTSIQVDDVPDVIRRRRPKQASVKTVGTPSP